MHINNYQDDSHDTISHLSTPTTASQAHSIFSATTDNVSMQYRVLTPPSSITGYTDARRSDVRHTNAHLPLSPAQVDALERRRTRSASGSKSNETLIHDLSSKIETNYEHLTRLDHVVSLQEETIRRQQETIQELLQKPPPGTNNADLLSATITITRFFRSAVRRIRLAKVTTQRRLASLTIQRCWVAYLAHTRFISVRQRAVVLQSLFRGHQVRRPTKFRVQYRHTLSLALRLKFAETRLEEQQTVCPITKEAIVDPLVCLVDEHTYEAAAVSTWVAKNFTSPLTREPCTMEDLVTPAELVPALRSMKIQAEAGIRYRRENEELRGAVAKGEAIIELASRKNYEQGLLHQSLSDEVAKLGLDMLKWKKEAFCSNAAREAATEETAQLVKRLSMTSRRAKSVQHERGELSVELARVNTEKDIMAEKIKEHKVLHKGLLEEMKSSRVRKGDKVVELRTQLKMAVEGCAQSPRVGLYMGGRGLEGFEEESDVEDYSDAEEYVEEEEKEVGEKGEFFKIYEPPREHRHTFPSISKKGRPELPVDSWKQISIAVGAVMAAEGEEMKSEYTNLRLAVPSPVSCGPAAPSLSPAPSACSDISDVCSYSRLQRMIDNKECRRNNVDPTRIEELLSDGEFGKAFCITRDQFREMPGWKQQAMKKNVGLF